MATDKAIPLAQTIGRLQQAAESSNGAPADATLRAPQAPTLLQTALQVSRNVAAMPPPGSCEQCLSLSFFFDGTGNNLDADLGTSEHSNVARLYRSHKLDDPAFGVFRFYVSGIGTYFKEIGDPGGTRWGLGFAAYGEKRLNWALERFEEKIRFAEARARNPANRVRSVRVAVFGFSRGAALARAFCRELQARCMPKGSGFVLKGRDYPVEISFLGIFDTVASVGVPLSVNRYGNHAGRMLKPLAFSMGDKPELYTLAFGAPGADPAPGTADGHGGWAEDLAIVPMVRQCLHLVAAHELRNSFPLDSVLAERHYPPGVAEIVYPGAHSDVGGGYRDGEGARSNLLAMIPLRVMHARACEAGVPLVPLTRLDDGEADFAVDAAGSRAFAELEGYFNHYMQAAGWSGGDLGARVLAHRALFYRWRFYQIARDRARNTPTAEQRRMRDNTQRFSREQAALERSVSEKKAALERAQRNHTAAEQARRQDQNLYYRAGKPIDPAVAAREHDARSRLDAARDAYLREKAKLDTAASDAGLEAALKKFDRQLMEDAAAIRQWRDDNPKLALRPHYRILLQAYEDEFVHGRGLRDAKIIHFFDHYVHDSLVAFDKDLTRCSDPRVIYIGGDRKLRYAGTGALAAHG